MVASMRVPHLFLALAVSISTLSGCESTPAGHRDDRDDRDDEVVQEQRFGAVKEMPRHRPPHRDNLNVQLGVRPYYLVDDMADSPLKRRLERCSEGPFRKSEFSIGHRGAALQFPEHTKESYEAAARMGAGIVECDVTFTKDRQLVCRHSQCDLHTTTNILANPALAAKCTQPFTPANPATGTPASAMCCTSDITLGEFKSLCGKMDASNPRATTVAEYLGGTATFRTDLYSTCGTVMTHRESISLLDDLGVKFTPELKLPSVTMPFQGDYTQEQFAQQMIDEYKTADISSSRVFPQSFRLGDVLYWLGHEPRFGRRAVFLDERVDQPGGYEAAVRNMPAIAAQGVKIIAPPMWALLTLDASRRIVPSSYAVAARAAGLDLITWTLERSGLLVNNGGYYYQSISSAIDNDGDMYEVLDVLARQVGIRGIFSDWPATVTYYANCMGL
jgi:glycerophosphoryl diester phosphodiesterase